MNLHQFRFVREAVRQNFNLTSAAKALFTSQPGVSKAIIELEEELGIEIFARHGKRLKRITEPGQHVLRSIELIMFTAEEPTRFGIGCLGSRLLAGTTTPAQAQALRDPDGKSLDDLRPTREPLSSVLLQPGYYAAFVELHIEQGRILEEAGQPACVVTSIAGQSRDRKSVV